MDPTLAGCMPAFFCCHRRTGSLAVSSRAHLQFDHAAGSVVTLGEHYLRWEPSIPILELAHSHIGLVLLPGRSCLATFQAEAVKGRERDAAHGVSSIL